MNTIGLFGYIALVALCAMSISFTITTTSIFKWLREWVSPWHKKIEELIHCPYCLAHYIVLAIMFTTDVQLVPMTKAVWFNFIFTWFVIVGIVGLLHFVILRTYEPVLKLMMSREIEKLKKQKKQ